MALISVVIPVYNAGKTLPDTIRALQAQSWTRWEAFLVDDGSIDASVSTAIAFAAQDNRIKAVANPGKGPSAARNHGAMALARGDVVSFCDADDLWCPDKLKEVAEAILGGDADAVFGRVGFFSGDPRQITSRSSVPDGPVTIPMLLAENPVCTMSNLSLRRDVFAGLGGLRADMVHNEDLDFLVTLVGSGARLEGLQSDHVLYRQSPEGLSSDLGAMRQSRAEVIRTAQRFAHDPTSEAEARYLRYLARRAMRLNHDTQEVQALVREGLREDAQSFLTPVRRGVPTALGGLAYPFLPRALRRFFFKR
ncbi:glycosyltransferase family 2 protein [Pacificoceanicola onchidii]|uniref:glycosyltransferase family 2 protein n=1 Tax=Pacificoceanicola onchidii TaxID=2562685 RepID=UPI0010A687C3|nr:glycosyltransferase family 2 protein [Pacificoceanicola onchidii]